VLHYKDRSLSVVLALAALIAFCSGFASLIYQINWQRSLTVVFGLSHYATTLTILGFFVGFGIGSYFAKNYADKARNPMIVIVVIESMIALFGGFSLNVFESAGSLNYLVSSFVEGSAVGLMGTRAILCLTLLILPTACMGATLPFLFRVCAWQQKNRGPRIGLLVSASTAGALLGSVITTWWFLGQIHAQTQMAIAAGFNLVAAGCALYLLRGFQTQIVPKEKNANEKTLTGIRPPKTLCFAFMLSGAASLGLELVWNRMAYMSLKHTIFTYAIVVSVYLAAYAAGALLSGLWLRTHTPKRNTVAALLSCSGLSTVGGVVAFSMGLHYSDYDKLLGPDGSALVIVMSYVFLPIFFVGLASPQIIHLITGDPKFVGRDTGQAMLWSNVGSIAAIIFVGFVLIPSTNLYVVTTICVALLFGSAVLMLDTERANKSVWRGYALVGSIFAISLWLLPQNPYKGWQNSFGDLIPVRFEEDASGLWGLYQPKSKTGHEYVLYLNDYYENYMADPAKGVIEGDFLLAPMVKPDIRSAYSIGLGFALEAWELLHLPEVEEFRTAELSPAGIILSKEVWALFGGGPFKDPRFKVLQDDGRILLEHLPYQYDLIYSGTNRSNYPHSTNLFSVDYFQLLKRKLNKGGLTQQWVPRTPSHQMAVIIKSFLSVFPDALLIPYFEPNRGVPYLYLLGFKDGIPPDFEGQVTKAFARAPGLFQGTTIKSPQMFFQRLMIPNRQGLLALDIETISDQLPVVEYDRTFKHARNWDELHELADPYSSGRLVHYLQTSPDPVVD